ncbi:MAG TPA: ribonuclease E/G, partial [Jatrophihabitans sp.]|nr:ribonuclease E/G [Jatrophihabitans sp.]
SEQDLVSDVERLKAEWESISRKMAKKSGDGPILVHGEPDLAIRVVRDIFNDDFSKLIVSGAEIHHTLTEYVADIAPDLADRVSRHTAESDLFADLRVDEQLAKALDRKVWLPSGGSLVIDRTEAMTVVDVNTGKYTGSGGNLEQTVTRNNLEAAEEIVRQLRLRDLGGIVVIDFIDMVLESNRELVLRRLTECLGRDRTKHQVAEVTSLGLVQMTRKRVGEGLLEAFSEPCPHCNGRGVIVHMEPVDRRSGGQSGGGSTEEERPARAKRTRKPKASQQPDASELAAESDKRRQAASAVAAIAAATTHKAAGPTEAAPDEVARTATELASQTGAIESAKSEPAESEPTRSRSTRSRSARSGAARSQRARSGQANAEPQPEPAQAGSAQAGSAQSGSAQSGSAQAGSAQSEPAAGSVNGSQPDQPASASARPRRRRAASRPAGPPVPVDAG